MKKIDTQTIQPLHKAALLVAVGALLLCVFSLPYFYYQLLRWLVCGVAAYTAYMLFQQEKTSYGVVFGFVAVLFNPIAPIFLERPLWVIVDIATAGLFAYYLYQHKGLVARD